MPVPSKKPYKPYSGDAFFQEVQFWPDPYDAEVEPAFINSSLDLSIWILTSTAVSDPFGDNAAWGAITVAGEVEVICSDWFYPSFNYPGWAYLYIPESCLPELSMDKTYTAHLHRVEPAALALIDFTCHVP